MTVDALSEVRRHGCYDGALMVPARPGRYWARFLGSDEVRLVEYGNGRWIGARTGCVEWFPGKGGKAVTIHAEAAGVLRRRKEMEAHEQWRKEVSGE